MEIYNAKKIANRIGLMTSKDYGKLLQFMDGHRAALTNAELTKLQKLLDKDYKIFTACIDEAKNKVK